MDEAPPSMTAAIVAATLLLSCDDPALGHLVDRRSLGSVERVVRHVLPLAGTALERLPWPLVRRISLALERTLSPGFVAHYALRKAAIRSRLAGALRDGHTQVVLLGAGFDMMSASVPDDVCVIEIDLPGTQRAKLQALEDTRMRRVTSVPADLSRVRLREVLGRTPEFDPAADTVFIAEGLLMYLELPAVDRLLSDLRHEERRTCAIMSFVTPDASGRARMHSQRWMVDLCMKLLGEEFVWGDHADGIRSLFERHGLCVDELVSNADLLATLPRGADRLAFRSSGEVIAVASDGSRRRATESVRSLPIDLAVQG